MTWHKLGVIFDVSDYDERSSHSSNPTVINCGDFIRVFYSTRIHNKSCISYFDFDLNKMVITFVSSIPYINHGNPGSVDESGLGLGCVLVSGTNNEYKLYSMGWQTPTNSHWRGDIVSTTIKLEKHKTIKVEVNNDPFNISFSYPFIIKKTKKEYRMYYGSTVTWDAGNGEMNHLICQARSNNLKTWTYYNQPIKGIIGIAQAFSRPTILYFDNKYHMWFSFRGNLDKYKIGYACSEDLDVWETFYDTFNVIVPGDVGWDSEMVCYPFVFEYDGEIYMVYNGNGYGKTGIGLAVMRKVVK